MRTFYPQVSLLISDNSGIYIYWRILFKYVNVAVGSKRVGVKNTMARSTLLGVNDFTFKWEVVFLSLHIFDLSLLLNVSVLCWHDFLSRYLLAFDLDLSVIEDGLLALLVGDIIITV